MNPLRILRPLVRHFLGSLIGRGVLQDDGVEAVRGLLFGVVAGLVSVGSVSYTHLTLPTSDLV